MRLFSSDLFRNFSIGFVLGAVASFLRMAGDVIASHQVSDRNWKRPNTRSLAAGGLSEGLSNICSGLLGAMPVNTNSGSVGLVAATGVSSRKIAWGVGGVWLVMGVLPFGAYLLLMIPEPVQGAAVLFTTGFVMRSGIAMLTQRMFMRIATYGHGDWAFDSLDNVGKADRSGWTRKRDAATGAARSTDLE